MASDRSFMQLVGLTEAKRQLAALEPELRRRSVPAIQASVDAIVAAARARTPLRQDTSSTPGYAGGALRSAIQGRVSKTHLIGLVGLSRGVIVVVHGQAHRVTTAEVVTRTWVDRRTGKTRTARRRRYASQAQRAAVRGAGGRVIQPTKYGHLIEFGTGRGRREVAMLRAAVRQERQPFESRMRAVAPDIERALAAQGLRP